MIHAAHAPGGFMSPLMRSWEGKRPSGLTVRSAASCTSFMLSLVEKDSVTSMASAVMESMSLGLNRLLAELVYHCHVKTEDCIPRGKSRLGSFPRVRLDSVLRWHGAPSARFVAYWSVKESTQEIQCSVRSRLFGRRKGRRSEEGEMGASESSKRYL